MSNTTPPPVGEFWNGGIYAGIVRDSETKQQWHLIVSESSSVGLFQWGPFEKIEGCESQADGQANTNSIIKSGHECPAAAFTAGLKLNDFDDWYWPSRRELAVMMNLADFISDEFHWSSTQDSASYAWYQDFEHGYHDILSKGTKRAVRAVRRLTI